MNRIVIFAFFALALAFSACAYVTSTVPSKAFAQAASSPKPPGVALNLPNDTLIFAKLTAELDTKQCKAGDHVEAEITHEVKAGHQTVLKRGSVVIAQIAKVRNTPDSGGLYGVGIVFENVAVKNGAPIVLQMEIQAIAPPPTMGSDADQVRDPRGLAATDIHASVAGTLTATDGPNGELTARSRGATRLPGVELGIEKGKGTPISTLTSKKGNIHLVKGSQILLRVVNP